MKLLDEMSTKTKGFATRAPFQNDFNLYCKKEPKLKQKRFFPYYQYCYCWEKEVERIDEINITQTKYTWNTPTNVK